MFKELKPWKKGAIIGGITGVIVIITLSLINTSTALIVVLFYPDFIIVGAIIGYLSGKFIGKKNAINY